MCCFPQIAVDSYQPASGKSFKGEALTVPLGLPTRMNALDSVSVGMVVGFLGLMSMVWAFFTLFDNRPDRDLLIPWAVATAGSAVATALICGVISLVVRELGSESD